MNKEKATEIIAKVWKNIFGADKQIDFDEFMQKYAYDIQLPIEVAEYETGDETWVSELQHGNYTKYEKVMASSAEGKSDKQKKELDSMDAILSAWKESFVLASEIYVDTIYAAESDSIYRSENVFRSWNIYDGKNIVLCSNNGANCEYVVASRGSGSSQYCIRLNNSGECNSSFDVYNSAKISRSFYVYNCFDMYECMFCSNMQGKKYCIANMQFEKEEYFRIKAMVIDWISNK